LLAEIRREKSAELNVEVIIANWLFEPQKHLVHGNVKVAEQLSGFTWPSSKSTSFKGPYGQTGLYGKDEEAYSCISEEDFFVGLKQRHISL